MALFWMALSFYSWMEFKHYMVGLFCFTCGGRSDVDIKYPFHVCAFSDIAKNAKKQGVFFCVFCHFLNTLGSL